MTFYGGGGLYDREASRSFRSGRVHKTYHKEVEVGSGPFDPALFEALASWFEKELEAPRSPIAVTDTDASYPVDNVWQAVSEMKENGTQAVDLRMSLKPASAAKPNVLIRYFESRTYATLEGTEPNEVFGLPARLKEAVKRGLIQGATPGAYKEYDAQVLESPEVRGQWFRNPWVIAIVSGLIVGVVLWMAFG